MTTLWLVRHGQTDWNVERRYQGHSDTPLNAIGIEQAAQAAEALAGAHYAALYSSDLQRARVTAEAIGNRLGLEVLVDQRLREVHLGDWEGMLSTDIQEQYPVEWEMRRQNLLHARPPGGENIEELAARIWPVFDELAARHRGEHVIVVSHGMALATVLCRTQGVALNDARDLIPENAQPVPVVWE